MYHPNETSELQGGDWELIIAVLARAQDSISCYRLFAEKMRDEGNLPIMRSDARIAFLIQPRDSLHIYDSYHLGRVNAYLKRQGLPCKIRVIDQGGNADRHRLQFFRLVDAAPTK